MATEKHPQAPLTSTTDNQENVEACEGCDGNGIRPRTNNGKMIAPPDGFVIVERCDSCGKYPDDLAAAKAWGTSAIWQAADHDWTCIQAICRPPLESDPDLNHKLANAGELLYAFRNEFGRLAVSQENIRRTITEQAVDMEDIAQDIGKKLSWEIGKRSVERDQEWINAIDPYGSEKDYSRQLLKTPEDARRWIMARSAITRENVAWFEQQSAKADRKIARLQKALGRVHKFLDRLGLPQRHMQRGTAGRIRTRLSDLLKYIQNLQK